MQLMPVPLRRSSILVAAISILMLGACDPDDAPPPRFAVYVIDDNPAAPPRADGALWLKSEGGMEGPFVGDARATKDADGQPVVEVTLTPDGRNRFAALTRANVGRRIAIVVNGTVVAASAIDAEMDDGLVVLSANYTEEQARALAAELTDTRRF
jgi:preprotein translocase subunit SecD